MLSSSDIQRIEKFISNPDNSCKHAPCVRDSTKSDIDIFDKVKRASAGAFHLYACTGFNEYAFYKSRENTIYSLTIYAGGKLSGYFKF